MKFSRRSECLPLGMRSLSGAEATGHGFQNPRNSPGMPQTGCNVRIVAVTIGVQSMTTAVTLLLVHGAWHGGSCWQPLIDKLQDVDVRTVELPSSGSDPARFGDMHEHARVVRKAVEDIRVVCAHSR